MEFYKSEGEEITRIEEETRPVVKVKVIGVGGGGNNAINRMINAKIKGIEFISINTDKSVLLANKAPVRLQIGDKLTRGHGAGNDPSVGEHAAEESRASINKILEDADLVFITAGMGGGTGTGAAPVVAKMAREHGILTVGVVTKPFAFEGEKRMANAERGIAALRKYVDVIMVIPNERLLEILPENSSVVQSYMYADEVLRQGIKGASDIILKTGEINLDFADFRKITKSTDNSNVGMRAHMGIGRSKGDNKVMQALHQAVSSPLLETSIEGAKKLLINFRCSTDLPLKEISKAAELVRQVVAPDCEIIFGNGIDPELGDEVEITLIATGLKEEDDDEEQTLSQPYFEQQEQAHVRPAERIDVEAQKQDLTNRLFENRKKDEKEAPAPEDFKMNGETIINVDDDDDVPPFLKRIRREGK